MLRVLVLVALAIAVLPSVAHACLNGTEWTTNDYVRLVVKAEKQLEAGQFGRAGKTLGRVRMPTRLLQQRADDVRAVIKLRTSTAKKDLEAVAKHFAKRTTGETASKDVRFKAWLAEAYVALGKKDDARPILAELHERDLMPDAYAYRALASLSTGTERYKFWKACRTRAKDKDICDLPAEKTATNRS